MSPRELVAASLLRIEQAQATLNPFAFVYAEQAMDAARAAAAAVAGQETLGPLHGVPIAIKDFTPTAGRRTTRGAYAFENRVPEHDPGASHRPVGRWARFTRSSQPDAAAGAGKRMNSVRRSARQACQSRQFSTLAPRITPSGSFSGQG